jgi:hypothetical protein
MPSIKSLRRVANPKLIRKVSPADRITLDEKTTLILQQIAQEAEQLEDRRMRDLWMDALQTFATTGNIDKIIEICTWRRSICPIDEFLFSPTYLALEKQDVFPGVLECIQNLDTDQFVEAVLTGAIGTGKSTIANVMIARSVYKISCMRHPQTTFGVTSKSSLVMTIQSVRFNTAKKAIFEELGKYVNNSPYFQHVYPYDQKVTSQMIFREQGVSILPVTSNSTGAISLNVIGGILDEVNYMQKVERSKSAYADEEGSFDQAKSLYNTLARRRRSRFTRKGKLPGILFVISSSRFPDDFTELKAAEAEMCGGTDKSIYVYRHSQWTAKARETFMDEEFRVQIGTERLRSKVLGKDEKPMPGCEVITVPMDFYAEFVKDTDGALRDYAGITTLATKPFITRRDAIYECMEAGEKAGYLPIYNVEEIDLSLGIPKPIVDRLRTDLQGNPFRAAHIDLGLTKDACGIAIGHLAGTKVVERKNHETGQNEIEILPLVGLDLVLRVVPPHAGEIEFSYVRRLILDLRDKYDIPIKYVTFDGFQSIDSRQILRKHGFLTDYHSVEKVENYRTFRDALYDTRVLLPKNQHLAKELAELEIVVKNNTEKVDHRPNGTKDVADAVCGVVSFLLKRRAAWAGMELSGRTGVHMVQGHKSGQRPEGEAEPETTALRRPSTQRRNIARRNIQRRSYGAGNPENPAENVDKKSATG